MTLTACFSRTILTAAALALVSGCSTSQSGSPPRRVLEDPAAKAAQKDTLYMRIGGEPAISAVVDDFVARTAANPKVNFTRKGTAAEYNPTPENLTHLKKMLVEMICQATGGRQKYTGRDMKSVHANMAITGAEFDAMAADFAASLGKLRVPGREREELMAIVASTRADVVTRP